MYMCTCLAVYLISSTQYESIPVRVHLTPPHPMPGSSQMEPAGEGHGQWRWVVMGIFPYWIGDIRYLCIYIYMYTCSMYLGMNICIYSLLLLGECIWVNYDVYC